MWKVGIFNRLALITERQELVSPRTSTASGRCSASTFADLEITPMQFAILEVIGCNEGLAQKNVAELVGTAPSVIVKPVRELEMRKLVGRKRSPDDRRHHVLSLTTAGKALQQEAQTRIQEVENNLLAPLNADERAKLLELLHKLLL